MSWNQSQLLTVHASEGAGAAYNIPMSHWVVDGRLVVECERSSAQVVISSTSRDGAFVSGRRRGSPCGAAHDVRGVVVDGGDDAFVQRVHGVLGGDGWCAGESAWYTEEWASSAASAEGIGGAMRRAALRCSGWTTCAAS